MTTRPARHLLRSLGPVLLGLALASTQGCGNGEAEAGADSGETSAARTGGIFGGTVQPGSEDRGSAPGATGGAELQSRSGTRPSSQAPPPSPAGRSAGIDVSEMGYTTGSASAAIRVIEFSDFGCHFCRKFHLETYPALHDQYVATGKVLWKYIPYVLGIFPHSVEAARAGECAISEDESRFPALRDRFFQDQKEWKEAEDPTETFTRLAEESGLDADEFRACLEEKRPEERVRRNIAVGRRIGVRGTPTFVVGGFPLSGAQPLEVFQQIFDQMLSDPAVGGEPTGGGTQ